MGGFCNRTEGDGWTFCSLPPHIQVAFGVIIAVLVLSLSWNIFCCVSKCCSGRRTCRPRTRRSRSSRQMEDNPIYGNINYMQTSICLSTEVDPPRSSLSSSSLRDPQRVNCDSQSKNQDCYANLTLKAPRLQTGCSSPQLQYSDVVHLEEPPESQKEGDGGTDTVSTMSDLYASVQTQRTKTIDTVDSEEGYANHL